MSMSNTILGVLFLILAVVLIIILIGLLLAGNKKSGAGINSGTKAPPESGSGTSIPPVKPEKIGERPVPPGAETGTVSSGPASGGFKGDLGLHTVRKPVRIEPGEVKDGDDEINRIYAYQPVSDIRVCRYCETENAASATRCCVCNQYLR